MHHRYKTKTRPVDHWSGPQKLNVKLHWNHLHVNDAIITSLKLLACHIRLFKLFVGIEKDSWDEMILSVVRFNWMVRILEWRTIGINSWYLTTHNTSKLNWAQSSSDLFSSVCLVVNFSHFIFSRTTGPISTKLGTKHSWLKKIQVWSNAGSDPLLRGDNSEVSKIHWQYLKIFSSEPLDQFQLNLAQIILG